MLYDFMDNPSTKKIYFLPLIGCLWSNLHGGSSNLSYLLCIVFLVCTKLEFKLGRVYSKKLEKKAFIKLLLVSIGTVLSVLINPIGLKVLAFPYTSLGDNLMMKIISEWQAPDAKLITLPLVFASQG